MLRTVLAILLAALLAPAVQAQATGVSVVYRTLVATHDSAGVGQVVSFDAEAEAVLASVFQAAGRAAPRTTGQNGTVPTTLPGHRLFELHAAQLDSLFMYAQTFEAGELVPPDTMPAPWWDWSMLNGAPPPFTDVTPEARTAMLRAAAATILDAMGWTVPTEPPPPAGTFYVLGPNPNRTGRLEANLPNGWTLRWFDSVGRLVGAGAVVEDLPSGVYFAVATAGQARVRHTRRALVLR